MPATGRCAGACDYLALWIDLRQKFLPRRTQNRYWKTDPNLNIEIDVLRRAASRERRAPQFNLSATRKKHRNYLNLWSDTFVKKSHPIP